MARPIRIEFPGAVYYVSGRGYPRSSVFKRESDRIAFLAVLEDVVERHRWLCHAYCLLGSRYELLIETPDGNLSRGMRQLNGIFTQHFNAQRNRSGPVFRGRFKAIAIERSRYLLPLCRQVVLTPVHEKAAANAGRFNWSSYRATAGHSRLPAFLHTDWLWSQFAKRPATAQARYRSFVKEGVGEPPPWDQVTGQVLLGGSKFVSRLKPYLDRQKDVRNLPVQRRLANRPTLKKLLGNSNDVSKSARDRVIRKAHVDYGYTLNEIGEWLGLHYSTISKVVNAPEDWE